MAALAGRSGVGVVVALAMLRPAEGSLRCLIAHGIVTARCDFLLPVAAPLLDWGKYPPPTVYLR